MLVVLPVVIIVVLVAVKAAAAVVWEIGNGEESRKTESIYLLLGTWLFWTLFLPLFFNDLLFKIFNFIYLFSWQLWVFIASCRLSLDVASSSTFHHGGWTSHGGGFPHCRAQALGTWPEAVQHAALVIAAFRLQSVSLINCGAQT